MAKKCGYSHKKCLKHDCVFFQQFRGQNPQTGQEEDKWECVTVMLPLLQLEASRQQRSTAAATEGVRNALYAAIDSKSPSEQIRAIGE